MNQFLGPFALVPVPHVAPPKHAAGPVGGGARSKVLGLVMQQQMGDFWCWAATASSVSKFYDHQSQWTQCDVASACLAQACCASPKPCDTPFVLEDPLQRTGNLQGSPFPGTATWEQVQTEIDAGRVVCCFIDWGDQSGHFVAISGYDRDTNDVVIDDPLYQRDTMPYDVFVSAYEDRGRWTYTYLTEA